MEERRGSHGGSGTEKLPDATTSSGSTPDIKPDQQVVPVHIAEQKRTLQRQGDSLQHLHDFVQSLIVQTEGKFCNLAYSLLDGPPPRHAPVFVSYPHMNNPCSSLSGYKRPVPCSFLSGCNSPVLLFDP